MREAEEGRGRQDGGPGATPAAAQRSNGAPEFAPSFQRLRDAVQTACAYHSEWEAKVGAAICAALEFAAAYPAAARAITDRANDLSDRAGDVVSYFARLLADVAPEGERYTISTDEAIVESIAILVRGHLLAGTTDELPELAPELIWLTLLPYTGSAGARAWSGSVALGDVKGTYRYAFNPTFTRNAG
jgi:hypothetical protein